MRLIDIILESNAVETAKQMGLVKKPGVALYGPPGDETPASHKIRGGELTPLKSTGTSRGMGQHSAIGATPDAEKSTSSDDSPVDDKPTQFSTIEEISQRVRDTLTPDGRIDDVQQTLSAVTSQFGRETCAPVYKIGRDFSRMTGYPIITWVAGVFLPSKDVIGLRDEVPDKPISEYDVDDIKAFRTSVHEALHSSRHRPDSVPKDQHPPIWKHFSNNTTATLLDEGMTEYLAQEITSTTLSDAPGITEIDWKQHGGYQVETSGVRFMVEYGNFDVVAAYQNYSHTTDEDGKSTRWEYVEQAHDAHDNAVIEILTRAGITEEELQKAGIITLLGRARKLNVFPLLYRPSFDAALGEVLQAKVNSNFKKPENVVSYLQDIESIIRRAIIDLSPRKEYNY